MRQGGREEGKRERSTSKLLLYFPFLPPFSLWGFCHFPLTFRSPQVLTLPSLSLKCRSTDAARRHHFTCCLGYVGPFAWGSEGNKTAVVLSLCICPRPSAAGNLENGWDCSCLPPCCELHHYDFSIEQAGQAGLPSLSLPLISLLLDSWPT